MPIGTEAELIVAMMISAAVGTLFIADAAVAVIKIG